jgi:TPP-dependent pyruvate/acetoin dehydrogenase alpha subunit
MRAIRHAHKLIQLKMMGSKRGFRWNPRIFIEGMGVWKMSRTGDANQGKEKKKAGSKVVAENPLVPNAVLRQMYQKMVELRALEAHGARGSKARRAVGLEACRASIAQGLGTDDAVMDSRPGALMDHLLGAKLKDVLKGKRSKRLLPYIASAEERLIAGLGAALLFKQRGLADGVVIFVEHKEASNAAWRKAFMLAATEDLPVIFVALPDRKGKPSSALGVSGVAHGCGVPGIHVDASDVIALYRVVQESWLRIRGGGGAVLIEGVPFHLHSKQTRVADPIEELGKYLVNRGVCTKSWLERTEASFQRRLTATGRV